MDGRVSSLRGSCPNLTFVIGGMTISADGSTEYRAGNCKHVEEGRRVLVVGHPQSEGRVRQSESTSNQRIDPIWMQPSANGQKRHFWK